MERCWLALCGSSTSYQGAENGGFLHFLERPKAHFSEKTFFRKETDFFSHCPHLLLMTLLGNLVEVSHSY